MSSYLCKIFFVFTQRQINQLLASNNMSTNEMIIVFFDASWQDCADTGCSTFVVTSFSTLAASLLLNPMSHYLLLYPPLPEAEYIRTYAAAMNATVTCAHVTLQNAIPWNSQLQTSWRHCRFSNGKVNSMITGDFYQALGKYRRQEICKDSQEARKERENQ